MTELTPLRDFLQKVILAAAAAGHPWPEFAAAEVALETNWGRSKGCMLANNLFGQKVGPFTRDLPTIVIPTLEWNTTLRRSERVTDPARCTWVVFPSWAECLKRRYQLLQAAKHSQPPGEPCPICGAAHGTPVYADALAAPTGQSFILLLSHHWATDPERGPKVLSIWRHYIVTGLPYASAARAVTGVAG